MAESDYVDCEFRVDRVGDRIVMTVLEAEDVSYHVMEPLDAALLAAALFDKAEQEENDPQ